MNGHRRLTNLDALEESAELSVEVAEPRTDRQTLDYYRPPRRPDRSLAEVEELAPLEEEVPSTDDTIVDAAAGSFGDASIIEVVIGLDDRVKVKDALLRRPPWRQICALRITAKTGRKYVGTAWFAGPRLLVTAGHCVYMQDQGGWADSIEVLAALRGNTASGRITAKRFGSVAGWVQSHQRDFDYGAIFLDDETLGKRLGNFGVLAMPDSVLNGRIAKISGYPADRDRAEYQYFHERPVKSTTPSTFNYDIDTYGGQSGSPVWCDTDRDGLVAVGIHTTGSATGNSATRITGPVIENLMHWSENNK